MSTLGHEWSYSYIAVQATGGYYLFNNVPYAQQPINELRFAKPQPITVTSTTVNAGNGGDIQCIQSFPQWIIDLQAQGNGISSETMASILYNQPLQTEECLLLNVYVPSKILAKGAAAKGMSHLTICDPFTFA